jgi:GAF domain-containing protein/HAMP domain-containing protein
MAVPAARQNEELDRENQSMRRALIVAAVIAILLVLISVASWFVFQASGRALDALVPITAIVVVLVGVLLIRQEQIVLGISLSLIALGVVYIFFIAQFGGIGLLAAIVFTLVAASAALETFPPAYLTRLVALFLVAGLLMLLLDLFWPGARREDLPSGSGLFLLLAIGAGLILVAYSLRRFPHFSLREKLVTAFLAVALLPLIAMVGLTNNLTRDVLIRNANLRLQAAAKQTAVSVDDFMDNSLQTIRTEANVIEESGFLNQIGENRSDSEAEFATIAQLKTFRDKDPLNISSYALLDTNGQVLLEYPLTSPKLDETDSDYVTNPLRSSQPYASSVQFTPVVGGPFIYFSSPVFNQDGEITAILRARYKAEILQDLIARNTGLVGGQSFAVLFDENLLHLAHGTAPDALYKLVAPVNGEAVEELQEQNRLPRLPVSDLSTNLPLLAERLQDSNAEPFFTAEDIATGEQLNQVAVTESSKQPWRIAFFQPQDVFLAPIEAQTKTAVILAVGVAAAVLAVAVVLSALITAPILRLEEAAERVADGDLNVRAYIESEDEIGSLAKTFNLMTSQLQETLLGLEQRVADRTQALATNIEVGRRLSTILDEQELVSEVVNQVQKSFGYYHAHIYLYDKAGEYLVMVGGTGEAGKTMLERGHKIENGKGLVGRAALLNSTVIAPNVKENSYWLANPLLPETKSEVAVPIAIGEQVLGVLDVQDREFNSLQQEDADLLLSVSNQVAIGLRNARSYSEIQSQAERRALINEINRKIQGTFDPEKAMQIAVRELGRAVGGRHTKVWLKASNDKKNGENIRKSKPGNQSEDVINNEQW